MTEYRNFFRLAVLFLLGLCAFSSSVRAQDLKALEEQAMRAAVAKVAPSVVRIQTIGGLDRIGRVLIGAGPTTGLIVSDSGYIVSSAFNFVQNPSSILVTLPSGERLPAQLVASDHSRMLVLLKVESHEKLPAPETAPVEEMKPGAWAIAVGRTFEGGGTNMSVGVISALRRNYGKAIQTDAKISPSNYGGPLVDIRGRVLGVLVPLSPQSKKVVAGVQWYDAGIGFAVPMRHLIQVLPKLQAGEDLDPGLLGVTLAKGDPYAEPPTLAAVHPNSPADEAGLKQGDTIVEIEGKPIATQIDLRFALGPRYAGETVTMVASRTSGDGELKIEKNVTLVKKLEPFSPGLLGVLPQREAKQEQGETEAERQAKDKEKNEEKTPDSSQTKSEPDGEETASGVAVRYVFPQSGADKAGIRPGDFIVAIDDQPTPSRGEAAKAMVSHGAGSTVRVKISRQGKTQPLDVVTSRAPLAIPADLPPETTGAQPPADDRPAVGLSEIQTPELKNKATLYVPENYDPRRQYGLVVWLHDAGGDDVDQLVSRWKAHCEERDLILLAPRAADSAKWERDETEFIRKALEQVLDTYSIDATRIVAHGYRAGGVMAYRAALQHRDRFRGVAVVEAPLPLTLEVPDGSPTRRQFFYSAQAEKSRYALRIEIGLKKLQDAAYPVTRITLARETGYLSDEELTELVRWMDSLDVL